MERHPPSVDRLARSLAPSGLPHTLCVEVARAAIAGEDWEAAPAMADQLSAALLGPVVNATGVLLHTNLGRAPLVSGPTPAVSGGSGWAGPARYQNLEIDVSTGRRGSRQGAGRPADLLRRLTGAEAALVVGNGAAAILLALAATAAGQRVSVGRGQLVEIGGGFRVPEVVAQSGCQLVEVGTTNRTRALDHAVAASDTILHVHPSNYRIVGFTEQPTIAELAALGRPVVADIGSGLLDASCPWLADPPPTWLAGEPAVRQALDEGAALVTFSCDKLLGGPQGGVIAGRRDMVEACANHPLARAMRPGGLVLQALSEVLLAYLRRDVATAVPFWRMALTSVEELRTRATGLGVGQVVDTVAVPGGGSVPGQEVPSAGVAVDGDVAAELRRHDPPVVARVEAGRTVCDLRTVDPADDEVVKAALASSTSHAAGRA
ncbi:MAG: L-seryl-tRNA(Sec) selenium transferase [uncultured Acidimicrobiales bacterium]|uniref:L-seryl-tRNA(Sec) selenium transferase n=1 Tax=uncultured Acidimicrobiales bacterium TaxID=310071 RepID=A0A6J4J1Z0_9ACTN|nr:MAG: L-seryl-tRNA(Sec) selenium transferase [uncultured Acidimicrobiales bacterium]